MGKSNRNICLGLLIAWSIFIIILVQLSHYTMTPISQLLPIHSARILLQMETTELPLHESYMHMNVLVDTREMKNQSDIMKEIQQLNPSLPLWYLEPTTKQRPLHKNTSCARYPSIYDLHYNNLYWQTFHSSNGTFQLYSAYYDNRDLVAEAPVVRILGMINRILPKVITYCQLWFLGKKEPIITAVLNYTYIWKPTFGNYKQNISQPYLITCKIPENMKKMVPKSVSLVEKFCENATNNLNVIYEHPMEKSDFAVCVKGLDFLNTDKSIRLVEWIELIHLLGADKIFFYELAVHPNISKVLKYYQKKNMITSTPITLPGGLPNAPGFQHLYLSKRIASKRQNELIPYNDCFYKNMYKYKYIILLDIDEVILPVKETNWKDLVATIEDKISHTETSEHNTSSYTVRNIYFLDTLSHDRERIPDIPTYMHMLQHTIRTKDFSKPSRRVKSFFRTDRVLAVHNHLPIECIGGNCSAYYVETDDAEMRHYRWDCDKSDKLCLELKKNIVPDTLIWRYNDRLIERTNKVLNDLGFL